MKIPQTRKFCRRMCLAIFSVKLYTVWAVKKKKIGNKVLTKIGHQLFYLPFPLKNSKVGTKWDQGSRFKDRKSSTAQWISKRKSRNAVRCY